MNTSNGYKVSNIFSKVIAWNRYSKVMVKHISILCLADQGQAVGVLKDDWMSKLFT